MILFARGSRLSFWLERGEGARALGCDPFDRRALGAERDALAPGGDTPLVLGAGARRRLEPEHGAGGPGLLVGRSAGRCGRAAALEHDAVYAPRARARPARAGRRAQHEAPPALLAPSERCRTCAARGFRVGPSPALLGDDHRQPSERLLDSPEGARAVKASPTRRHPDNIDRATPPRAARARRAACSPTVTSAPAGRDGHDLGAR
jgi:hypothetical protein